MTNRPRITEAITRDHRIILSTARQLLNGDGEMATDQAKFVKMLGRCVNGKCKVVYPVCEQVLQPDEQQYVQRSTDTNEDIRDLFRHFIAVTEGSDPVQCFALLQQIVDLLHPLDELERAYEFPVLENSLGAEDSCKLAQEYQSACWVTQPHAC